jgi:perosamine synthetase
VTDEIPFHRPLIGEEEIAQVVDSLRSGWITTGPKTVRFEEEFRRFVGAPHAAAVSSCTAALHLALRVIGLEPGDEVIVPDMTFTATGEVVTYFGARVVPVDSQPDTLNLDPEGVERAITPRTRAVIPVHYAGQPCDMDEILDLARRHRLSVIEDAAHCFPGNYRGRKVGTIGDLTCFSFYATKTLATGEGGMVTTGNQAWDELIRTLRLHGISRDAWKRYTREGSWQYEVVAAGYKYNLTDLQAALGLAQLGKAEAMRARRCALARRYDEAFAGGPFVTPSVRPDRESAWHLYPLRLRTEALAIDRDRFIQELKERGIGTSVHFIPLHRHPYWRDSLEMGPADFPVAEDAFLRLISLPLFPGLTEEEQGRVIQAVLDVSRENRR